MANKIQFKRGTKANLPTLAIAEPGFCTDTKELYVGSAAGNIPVGGSNKNLLHNWDWRKLLSVVNQRNFASGTVSIGQYFIDRWLVMDSAINITINASSITFSNSGASAGGVFQKTEQLLETGDKFSLSFNVASYSGNITMVLQDISNWEISISSAISYLGVCSASGEIVTTAQHRAGFLLAPGASITIYTCKLELGPVSTLANDPPADYGEQLALCQRYFIRLKPSNVYGLYGIGVADLPTMATIIINLPVPMRVVPTITTSGNLRVSQVSTSTSFTNLAVYSMNQSILHTTVTTSGLTAGVATTLQNNNDANAYIDLSAEL